MKNTTQKKHGREARKRVKEAKASRTASNSRDSQKITLAAEDAYLIAHLLTEPPRPNEALRRAAEAHMTFPS